MHMRVHLSSKQGVCQVAMEKTKGNNSAAIELLRKYLDLYQTDREAWEELADLYTQVQSTSKAASLSGDASTAHGQQKPADANAMRAISGKVNKRLQPLPALSSANPFLSHALSAQPAP